jgi:TATA-binding protein-associated factor
MALREILTHQGASAGVLVPDLNCSVTLVSNLKHTDEENLAKRDRGIDLNMQIISDESGPALKRQKFEDASSELMSTMKSSSEDDNLHAHVKVEDTGWTLLPGQANGELSLSSIKGDVEPESNLDGAWNLNYDVAEAKVYSDEKVSMDKMDVLKNLPENSELMNLVKLARHCWLKNCEFLQDCAIRFLCVLSLDRYDIVLLLGTSTYTSHWFPPPRNNRKIC